MRLKDYVLLSPEAINLDDSIWPRLFGGNFDPLGNEDRRENWRVLLRQPVVDHITKVFAMTLLESEQKHVTGQIEVHQRRLSEVPRLMVRESHSVAVAKCIYTRLGWPAFYSPDSVTWCGWRFPCRCTSAQAVADIDQHKVR